jgi:pimeloyl-ACP methyl ester carboxylesterase
VRTRGTGTPIVVLPGGPGLASVLPYASSRKRAAARGLDVIMIEHRGVGLSRRDGGGADLPVDAVTVESAVADVAAVLDDAGIGRAVVWGSSYGTYLAQGFGLRHPERVAGMVLDSPVLSAGVDDARAHLRRLLWDGADPGTAGPAARVRELAGTGSASTAELSSVVQVVYEFLGPAGLERFLAAVRAGRARRTWRWLAGLSGAETGGTGVRYVFEPDLVAGIAYGELGYGAPPDGHPLDPQASPARAADRHGPFTGEPYDLPAALPGFGWPLVVLSGDRDLRTPRPVAERIAALAPDAVLLPVPDFGHSVLDGHPDLGLLVAAAVAAGAHRRLPELGPRLAGLPRRGRQRLLGPLITARLAAERLLPPTR